MILIGFNITNYKIDKIEEVTTLMRVSVVFLEPDKGGSGMKS